MKFELGPNIRPEGAGAGVAVAEAPDMPMQGQERMPFGQKIALGLSVAALAFGAKESIANASAVTPEQPQTTTEVRIGGTLVPAVAMAGGKVEVIANHRDKSVSKADIREARRDGDCEVYTEKEAIKAGVVTQGYNNSGVHYAPENRRSTICEVDGKLIRIECGNRAKVTEKPRPKKAALTAWINSWNKAKIKIKAVTDVNVGGTCETPDGKATGFAYARARGVASIYMKWKNVAKAGAKGVTKKFGRLQTRTEQNSQVNMRLDVNSYAQAVAICKQMGGSEAEFVPTKDGTDTPQPPANAPGPIPAPSPEEPYPGGYECYDEITGAPEQPNSDGTCKPGDVGNF